MYSRCLAAPRPEPSTTNRVHTRHPESGDQQQPSEIHSASITDITSSHHVGILTSHKKDEYRKIRYCERPHSGNFYYRTVLQRGFPGGLDGEESTCGSGDLGSIPGLGRSPGEGRGYPPKHSVPGDPEEPGRTPSRRVTKSLDTTEQPSTHSVANVVFYCCC